MKTRSAGDLRSQGRTFANSVRSEKKGTVGQTEAAQRGEKCNHLMDGSKVDPVVKPHENRMKVDPIWPIVTAEQRSRSWDSVEPLDEAARTRLVVETSSNLFPELAAASCAAIPRRQGGDRRSDQASRPERDCDSSKVLCPVLMFVE